MRKPIIVAALALLAVTLNMGSAKATQASVTYDSDSTCPNTYSACVSFSLSQNTVSDLWTLTTDYVSSPSGLLTSTGAYYNDGSTSPNFDITNVTLVGSPAGWQTGGCTDLNMNSGSTDLLSACGSTTQGINDALSPGQSISLTFDANSAFLTAAQNGLIDYRAHIQGYGTNSCSIKLDTGVQGNVGSAGTDCLTTTSVPEPDTLALFGAGLAALGIGFALRRRARQS